MNIMYNFVILNYPRIYKLVKFALSVSDVFFIPVRHKLFNIGHEIFP